MALTPRFSPETVLILRALSNFEALYLSRSSNRLNETVGQAFAGGSKAPPGMNEGIAIARTIANELDSAKFDPLLVRAVSKSVVGNIDLFLSRVDGLVRLCSCSPFLRKEIDDEACRLQEIGHLSTCWAPLRRLNNLPTLL